MCGPILDAITPKPPKIKPSPPPPAPPPPPPPPMTPPPMTPEVTLPEPQAPIIGSAAKALKAGQSGRGRNSLVINLGINSPGSGGSGLQIPT